MTSNGFANTTVDLLRHGECEGGAIYRGVTDSPLTPAGWRQMHRGLADLAGWQAVVTSPLQRCRPFAEEVAGQHQVPLEADPAFREVHFGAWEGRTIESVWNEEPELAEAYYRQPGSVAPEGGESLAAASERVVAAWRSLLARYRGQHLLLVAHGGVIRLLLCHVIGAPLASSVHWEVGHGSLARVRIHSGDDEDFHRLVLLRTGEAV